MKEQIRLDKYLADMGVGTRSEVKNMIRKGRIMINDTVNTKPETRIHILNDEVLVDGTPISYASTEYYMLNKPAGTVSATVDNVYPTVISLITDKKRKDLFPAGRLDVDTEGLLLITNDGGLVHKLLSPKNHIAKVYYAKVDGYVDEEDIKHFQNGVAIGGDEITLPASLNILKQGEVSEVELTIYEGKFHQVKRMFEAVGKQVLYLKRKSMGPLILDSRLELGEYRELTEEELSALKEL